MSEIEDILVEGLRSIAEGRGKCEVCGQLAELGSGYVSCNDNEGRNCTWSPRDPAEVAVATLSKAGKTDP